MGDVSKGVRAGLGAVFLALHVQAGEPITIESLLRDMVDRDAGARCPQPAFRLKQESSYNRASRTPRDGRGWFTNKDYHTRPSDHDFIRVEENGGQQEWVSMDHEGALLLPPLPDAQRAKTVDERLTGVDDVEGLSDMRTSRWKGFLRKDFESDGRAALLVFPETAAPGKPWIWRTEFFGAFDAADQALLKRGWAVAYVDVRDLYGAPVALDAMDRFYAKVTAEHALHPRVVLEGFSRGGLYAFNWAARHPDRVAGIYADAPVLDFKSWPGGQGDGKGSPGDWRKCLDAYQLTEAEALAYPLNPVDNLKPLADACIPILIVAGDADKAVPVAENALLAEARYQAFGGTVHVILKPGVGHHPHSLEDPAPIVDFITTWK